MLLDLSDGPQGYVEDCEVCCNPISVSFGVDETGLIDFSACAAQ